MKNLYFKKKLISTFCAAVIVIILGFKSNKLKICSPMIDDGLMIKR